MDKEYTKHGVDNMTISLNREKEKEKDWHDDWKGTLIFDNEPYYVNLKNRNNDWIVGTIKKKPPKDNFENNYEDNNQKMEENNEQKTDEDGDEIPF